MTEIHCHNCGLLTDYALNRRNFCKQCGEDKQNDPHLCDLCQMRKPCPTCAEIAKEAAEFGGGGMMTETEHIAAAMIIPGGKVIGYVGAADPYGEHLYITRSPSQAWAFKASEKRRVDKWLESGNEPQKMRAHWQEVNPQ